MNDPIELKVPLGEGAETTALLYAAAGRHASATYILAHGAGAGQRSGFIVSFGHALSALGLDVVSFNFPFTEQHRRFPDRTPVLEHCYRAVIDVVRADVTSARTALVIGGKSMGGRMATHIAAAAHRPTLAGIVLLGYPLHPPRKPLERRDAHLQAIECPMLFVQGSRDPFGTPDELAPIVATLRPEPTLHVIANGDHSFHVPRRNPVGQAAVFEDVQRVIADWIRGLTRR